MKKVLAILLAISLLVACLVAVTPTVSAADPFVVAELNEDFENVTATNATEVFNQTCFWPDNGIDAEVITGDEAINGKSLKLTGDAVAYKTFMGSSAGELIMENDTPYILRFTYKIPFDSGYIDSIQFQVGDGSWTRFNCLGMNIYGGGPLSNTTSFRINEDGSITAQIAFRTSSDGRESYLKFQTGPNESADNGKFAIVLDDISLTKATAIKEDFENVTAYEDTGFTQNITDWATNPTIEISETSPMGLGKALHITNNSSWNTLLCTDKFNHPLVPNTEYVVSFKAYFDSGSIQYGPVAGLNENPSIYTRVGYDGAIWDGDDTFRANTVRVSRTYENATYYIVTVRFTTSADGSQPQFKLQATDGLSANPYYYIDDFSIVPNVGYSDFENYNTIFQSDFNTDAAIEEVVTGEAAISGSSSIRIMSTEARDFYNVLYTNPADGLIVPGKTYQLGFTYKADSSSVDGLQFAIGNQNGQHVRYTRLHEGFWDGTLYTDGHVKEVNGSREVKLTFTAQENEACIFVQAGVFQRSIIDMIIDDLYLIEVGTTFGYNAQTGMLVGGFDSLKNTSEVGFKVDFNDGSNNVTKYVSSFYTNENIANGEHYIVTDGKVYYNDIDFNGKMDATDVTILRKNLFDGTTQDRCDLTGDGEINILDLVRFKKILVADRDTLTDYEGNYKYPFSLSSVLSGANDSVKVTPYSVVNGEVIYGVSQTVAYQG